MVQIDLQNESGVMIGVLSGEIDGHTAGQVQDALLPVFETSRSIILDMTGVTFMSSAGLRMLLLVYRQAAARDGKVILVGLSDQITDTMSITGFLGFFTVCPTVESAREAMGSA
jgi:anti-sigma B factor antagonist